MANATEQFKFLMERDIKPNISGVENGDIRSVTNSSHNGTTVKAELASVNEEASVKCEDHKTSVSPHPLSFKSEFKTDDEQLVLTCLDCQKNFLTKEDIEKHIISGICGGVSFDTCWSEFLDKDKLLDHFQFSCLIFRVDGKESVPPTRHRCLECGKWCATRWRLMRHEGDHHQLKTCDHCQKKWRTKAELRSHMRSHWPTKLLYNCALNKKKVHECNSYKCKICKQNFSSRPEIVRHMRSHRGKGAYSCEICGTGLHSPKALKGHMAVHNDDRPFKCGTCSKSFKWLQGKQQHEAIHSLERFRCSICSRSFALSYRYLHVKSHLLTFECHVCHGSFKNSRALVRHVKRVHHSWEYTCHDCGKKFPSKGNLKYHVMVHLDYKCYRCEVCGKDFKLLMEKVRHMRVHSDVNPFECEICRSKFKSEYVLKDHMLSHTGEKPYGCRFCDMKFAKYQERRKHVKGHSGSFKCEECGENFETKSRLSWHVNMKHTKKEKCSLCGREFKALQIHIYREHRRPKQNPYSCKICKKEFRSKYHAKRHIKEIHKASESNLAGGEPLETNFLTCEFCDATFSSRGERLKHVRSHKIFKCEECEEVFGNKLKLTWHMKKIHAAGKMH